MTFDQNQSDAISDVVAKLKDPVFSNTGGQKHVVTFARELAKMLSRHMGDEFNEEDFMNKCGFGKVTLPVNVVPIRRSVDRRT